MTRQLRTVRISVCGACDLNCVYCDAPDPSTKAPVLSADDVVRLAEAALAAGARTVRLTGGEPLLRDDVEDIVSRIRAACGDCDIALTTNAQRLAARARSLKEAGLDRVNIGLPSLLADTYRKITSSELAPALTGLEAALEAGLTPLKMNVVLVKNVNASEMARFVEFARTRPVEIRFIEVMPFAGRNGFVAAADTRALLGKLVGADGLGTADYTSTAEVYSPPGFAGALGLITPVSEPFCGRCDRLRVTSDAKLRACLSEPGETDVRALLDGGADTETIARAMRAEFGRKPSEHCGSFNGPMRRIGG